MSKILIAAGVGGTLPTRCRLAATYSVGNDPPPGFGIYIALGLFALIGMAVAFGFGESELKKAFVLGIAGPAIVTSTFNAVSQAKSPSANARAQAVAVSHHDTMLGAINELFGITEARAQTSPESPTKPRQLAVVSKVAGVAPGNSIDPIELEFISDTGAVLDKAVIDPKSTAMVRVPAGASTVAANVAGKVSIAKLPSNTESARLNLKIDASWTSQFQWALGNNSRVRVESVSASVDNLAPTSGPTEPLKAGSKVYSKSGVPLGVVETVKSGGAGEPAQAVIVTVQPLQD